MQPISGISPLAGEQAPKLMLWSLDGVIEIPDPAGRIVALMFYHEASTPACATQLASLYAEKSLLDELGAVAVFVSTDPVERQSRFADALGIPSGRMVSDERGEAAEAYGVFDEGSGRAHRAAFVIGADGRIVMALPRYSHANSDQLLAIFSALGVTSLESEEVDDG